METAPGLLHQQHRVLHRVLNRVLHRVLNRVLNRVLHRVLNRVLRGFAASRWEGYLRKRRRMEARMTPSATLLKATFLSAKTATFLSQRSPSHPVSHTHRNPALGELTHLGSG